MYQQTDAWPWFSCIQEIAKKGAGEEGAYTNEIHDKSKNPACGQKQKQPPAVKPSSAEKKVSQTGPYVYIVKN